MCNCEVRCMSTDSVGHKGSSVTMYADGNVCNVHVCVCACICAYCIHEYHGMHAACLGAWVHGCFCIARPDIYDITYLSISNGCNM